MVKRNQNTTLPVPVPVPPPPKKSTNVTTPTVTKVTTTRNVTSTPFVDWFCGGLQFQVDHHLFPQIPRHNLAKVHTLVESFCKQHGVSYHEASIYDGTIEVLEHLSTVSKEFIAHFPAM